MRMNDILKSTAFRLAVIFALVVTLSTCAVFAIVYWQVSNAEIRHLRVTLEDEVAHAAIEPTDQVKSELSLRLTRDLRRIEYVGLFDAKGKLLYGNVAERQALPVDGRAHYTEALQLTGDDEGAEPVVIVAQHRPDGGILVLGRSLYEVYALRRSVLEALAIGVGPAIILALIIGALFSLQASRRLKSIQHAVNRVVQGDLRERLPVHRRPDDIDEVVRSVNLMLDEIYRLINQLKSVGDNIAHDLRTPLALMRVRLERGLNGADDKLRDTAQQALCDLDRAITTVTALLRISEIEAGLRRSAFAAVDFAEVCREVFDLYEPMAEAKRIAITLEAGEAVPMIGDAELLWEALTNLVDNAIKFTPEGGAVLIAAKATAEGPCVRVSDNGPGIPPADRDKVFKRFHRCSSASGIPGNGLGLSMAATIVELHGLTLRLEDNHPGASFEIAPQTTALLAANAALHESSETSRPRKLFGTRMRFWRLHKSRGTPPQPESATRYREPPVRLETVSAADRRSLSVTRDPRPAGVPSDFPVWRRA